MSKFSLRKIVTSTSNVKIDVLNGMSKVNTDVLDKIIDGFTSSMFFAHH